jgi:molybdate transport system substrate-binding protein
MRSAIAALLLMASGFAQDRLRIAAASDLTAPFKELIASYEEGSRWKIDVSFGSSGNLFAQIQNGAPYDIFLSADSSYPNKLVENGLVVEGSLTLYAVGELVVWAPASSGIDVEKLQWKALAQSSVHKIAIANPDHAPYGRAAVEAMQRAGVYDAIKDKLVLGENVSQAAQFVQSGNAEAGIIALSMARVPEMKGGKYWAIPRAMHAPLLQSGVVLKSSKQREGALAFLRFVTGPKGQSILAKYGLQLPPPMR